MAWFRRHPLLRAGDRSVDRYLGAGRWRAAWWESRVWLSSSTPTFIGLRATGRLPLVRLGRFGTLVNDARIGREILLDTAHFRTVGPGTHGELLDQVVGPRALLNMDGTDHEALRRSLHDLFGVPASRALVETTVTEPLAEVDRRLRAGQGVDLVRALRIITGRTTFGLLGAPEPADGDDGYLAAYRQGEELLAMTVRAVRRGIRPTELARATQLVEALGAGSRAGWESTGDGTMPRLRRMGMTFEDARSLIVVIILAGTETVSSGAPRAIATLMDHGAWDGIDPADDAALDAAVEAGLRLVTPSQFIIRSCADGTVVRGHRFKRGERVFLSLYNMARTPALYRGSDPEALHLGEPVPHELRHIWFGAGPHFCIGSAVAREQLRAVLRTLRGVGDLRIVDRRPASGVLFPAYAEFWLQRR